MTLCSNSIDMVNTRENPYQFVVNVSRVYQFGIKLSQLYQFGIFCDINLILQSQEVFFFIGQSQEVKTVIFSTSSIDPSKEKDEATGIQNFNGEKKKFLDIYFFLAN